MHKICFTISFISCLYMFRALCAHHQEVKIALHSFWYHHAYRCDGTRWDARSAKRQICVMFNKAFFFRKSCRLWDNLENIIRAGQSTDDNLMRVACCIPRLQTQTENIYLLILLYFHGNISSTNTSRCYVIRTLTPVLLHIERLYLVTCYSCPTVQSKDLTWVCMSYFCVGSGLP